MLGEVQLRGNGPKNAQDKDGEGKDRKEVGKRGRELRGVKGMQERKKRRKEGRSGNNWVGREGRKERGRIKGKEFAEKGQKSVQKRLRLSKGQKRGREEGRRGSY